ncbi:MAG: hypothetical protein ACXABY_04275 [Candidatus Thorarchaeota archaeon]|jgi:hypothetical protein
MKKVGKKDKKSESGGLLTINYHKVLGEGLTEDEVWLDIARMALMEYVKVADRTPNEAVGMACEAADAMCKRWLETYYPPDPEGEENDDEREDGGTAAEAS